MNNYNLFKYLLLSIFTVSLIGKTDAQNANFGIKGGLTYIETLLTFYPETGNPDGIEMTSDAEIGFGVGLFIELPLSGYLSIQPEVHYMFINNKGAEQYMPRTNVHYQTLQVPLLLRINIPFQDRSAVYFLGGPYGGYFQKAEVKANGSVNDLTDELKYFYFGATGGTGIQTGRISVEVRYNFGLTNILVEDDEIGAFGIFEGVQNGFYATLGYSF
ncbi:MAG: PorT family protein [Balneolaceae bacterium]|nr:MAG: PorT family protein [Balneolaceae bacterium]